MAKPVVAITIGREQYPRMFSQRAWKRLATFAEITHHPGTTPAAKADLLQLLPGADACITGWDVAPLDLEVIAAAPSLRAVAHLGGSVKRFFSEAVWERSIQVTSAAPALARDVAETTLGLMIVGMKRIWPLARQMAAGGWREGPVWPARELHGSRVGLIGAGNVGRHLIQLLRPFETQVLLYDPYVTAAEAAELGVTLVDLEELVTAAELISLHAPAVATTYQMLDARLLARMRDDAILINTARGSLIDEAALISELQKGRLFAFLDVTDPEPAAQDSLLRRLDNVVLTPHLAGCISDCSRMGEMAVEELHRFFHGEPAINPINPSQFSRIA